jgi:Uma2 family endonuclease
MTPIATGPWTVDDLCNIPDDGNRYEISDGSLLVSPPPTLAHGLATDRLTTLLKRNTPEHLLTISVGVGFGFREGTSYFIPDLLVMVAEASHRPGLMLEPQDIQLAVEVLSPGSRRRDLGLKRRQYAAAGIPDYWIVDATQQTLTVFRLDGAVYREEVTVKAGEPWTTTRPFPVTLDPADFC